MFPTASKGSGGHHLPQQAFILGKADHGQRLENTCLFIQDAINDLDLPKTEIQALIPDLFFILNELQHHSSLIFYEMVC